MSLSSGELLIKESLTKVDPELATPQGYPLEIRHLNCVRHCQQEAPLPREQPVPTNLSVSVLKVLALEAMSSQLLVLIFLKPTSNGKGNTTSGLSLASGLLIPAMRKASGAFPSYVKFLRNDNLEKEDQRFLTLSPT